MIRLQNKVTGVLVEVPEQVAATLDREWVAITTGRETSASKPTVKKTTKK